jgi:hypothetical protein
MTRRRRPLDPRVVALQDEIVAMIDQMSTREQVLEARVIVCRILLASAEQALQRCKSAGAAS